jgi:lysophospholipase L1-like esterase
MRPISQFFRQMKLKIVSLLLLFKVQSDVAAQPSASNFEPEINYYRHADDTTKIPAQPIVFLGSSSIKNWIGLDSSFTGYPVLNRGFGGSTLKDQIYYANDIALKHNAKQFVIYCGENDFANESNITPEQVFERFKTFYTLIRNKYPETPIVYIGLKPSPAKLKMMSKIFAYNQLVKDFIATEKNIVYADVFSPMLMPDGQPDSGLFFDDKLHMNRKGYRLWTEIVKPLLLS